MNVHLVPLADAVAPVRAEHRSLIADVRASALARGRTVDPDVLALLIAVATERTRSLTTWTRPGVNQLLATQVSNWCSARRVLIPLEGLEEAMWALLDHLADGGLLDPASDDLAHLREPLICGGGLDLDGRRRPEDSESPIECACYFPVGTPMSVVRAARGGGR